MYNIYIYIYISEHAVRKTIEVRGRPAVGNSFDTFRPYGLKGRRAS